MARQQLYFIQAGFDAAERHRYVLDLLKDKVTGVVTPEVTSADGPHGVVTDALVFESAEGARKAMESVAESLRKFYNMQVVPLALRKDLWPLVQAAWEPRPHEPDWI